MDIGGTNFRVLYVKLSNKRSVVVSSASSHGGVSCQDIQYKSMQ